MATAKQQTKRDERDEREAIARRMEGIAKGLAAIDAAVIEANGGHGEPGSGLHMLLDQLAVTHHGIPRIPFPIELPPDEPEPAEQRPDARASRVEHE